MLIRNIILFFVAALMPFWVFTVAPIFGLNIVNLPIVIGLIFIILEYEMDLTWAFMSGFLLDIFSDSAFGAFTISLLVVFGVARYIQIRYRKGEFLSLFFLAFCSIFIYKITLAGITHLSDFFNISDHVFALSDIIKWNTFFEVLVTAIVLIVVKFLLYSRGHKSLAHI